MADAGRDPSPASVDLTRDNPFGPVPTPAEIRESLRSAPRPNVAMDYDVTEAVFWQRRHLPAGSVITYGEPPDAEGTVHLVALLVLQTESRPEGIWIRPKVLGAETEEVKKRVTKYFQAKSKRVHICCVSEGQECADDEHPGLHITRFRWYPPGDFRAPWLSSKAKKLVQDGIEMEVEEEKRRDSEAFLRRGEGRRETGPDLSVEERLASLRRPPALRRVRFADDKEPSSIDGRREHPKERAKVGTGTPAVGSASLVPRPMTVLAVKDEVIDVEEDDRHRRKTKKKKERSLGQALARAASAQSQLSRPSSKRKRSRSRSKSKKSKSKRKEAASSRDSSDSSDSGEESSDESLIPPLKKKAMRTPGAVYKMLEDHMAERLSQDVDLGPGLDGEGNKPKFHTYFQLCLRPQLDPRSRDAKELSLLTRLLDLLRAGKLDSLGDMVAARLMAVDAATRQGWQTAKYLEIELDGEEGCAPPHILLAAQRHGRMVDKAGGKGSWSRTPSWSTTEWSQEPRKGKGKDGKGKTKKGKGKGKGQKGHWGAWYTEDKPKAPDAPVRKEADK